MLLLIPGLPFLGFLINASESCQSCHVQDPVNGYFGTDGRMASELLPQAMKVIIPPTGNELVTLLKTTSLVAVIGAGDLLTQGTLDELTLAAEWLRRAPGDRDLPPGDPISRPITRVMATPEQPY